MPCLVLICLSCCLLLTGCASDKAGAPPEKLIIAVNQNLSSALVRIAAAKGFFRQQGLDVTLQSHTSGKPALQSVVDAKADLATVSDTEIMFAMMQGARFSLLATTSTSTKDEIIVAAKGSGIASPQDLKGRRIGVPFGTGGHYLLDSYLLLNAISRHDVVLVDLKAEQMPEALRRRQIDAVVCHPRSTAAVQEGTILESDNVHTKLSNLIARQSLASQSGQTIERLLRAMVQAEDFAAAYPLESQQIVAKSSGMRPELVARLWDDIHFSVCLTQALPVTLEEQARWAMKNGLTGRRDLPDFFEFIRTDGLMAVKPAAVRIIR